jgi:MerR family redox-sensitive transcriptional activator SoxR
MAAVSRRLQLKVNFKASVFFVNYLSNQSRFPNSLFYDAGMAALTISQVARQVGLESSAIRYYERIGLLPTPARQSGQRRYDATALYRLAIIQRARQLGFTLEEVRQLFFGFREVRASARWQKLCRSKLTELQALADGIKTVQRLLRKMMRRCHCETLDQCGRGIFRSGISSARIKPRSLNTKCC